MKKFLIIKIVLLFLICEWVNASNLTQCTFEKIEWNKKNFISDSDQEKNFINTYGSFSGIIDNNIIIVGGSSKGSKQWNNYIYVVPLNGESFKIYRKYSFLKNGLADGVSIVLPGRGLLCIGGHNSIESRRNVFLVEIKNGKPIISYGWPSLPVPLINATGGLLDNKIYIVGGYNTINSIESSNYFYVLDLSKKNEGWVKMKGWPGGTRENAVCVIQNNGNSSCLYIFGGQTREGVTRKNLYDGYVFNPQFNEWSSLGVFLPFRPEKAFASGSNHIIFFGRKYSKNDKNIVNIMWVYHTITKSLVPEKQSQFTGEEISNIMQKNRNFYLIKKDTNSCITRTSLLEGRIISQKKDFGLINIFVIIGYFIILSLIGFYFSKRQKSTNDYFKGGGRIPWWAAGLSLFGTALSAITFMAIPAKAYATDWSYLLFNFGIIFVAPIIVFIFIPYFRRLNITTAYQYLEIRFNSTIRVICSLAFIVFQIGRMGVVLFLPSIALNVVTGIDIFLCIGLMGACSILYTMVGGIEAVVWTDALQVIILLGGAIFAIVYIINDIPGGLNKTIAIAVADGKFNIGSLGWNLKDSTVWTVLIATCFTNLTMYGTDQSMVQRYLTTSSLKEARKSVWTNAILTIPATIIFFFIGTALYVYYKTYPTELSMTISNGDAIFPWYIFTKLPTGLSGLLISGIFAAAMSTLSGSLNSAATAFVIDIRSKIIHKENQHSELIAARLATMIIGLISLLFAIFMATCNIASLWDEFNKILGLILGSLGGLFLLGMITKRANSTGAIIGLIASIVIQLYIIEFKTLHLLLYTASGFISCFLIGYIVSLISRSKKTVNFNNKNLL